MSRAEGSRHDQDPGSTTAAVIPARNEARNIRHAIRTMHACRAIDEVYVVDGGSEDGTVQIAEDAGVEVLLQGCADGPAKGEAIALAVEHVHADVLVFFDADLYNMTPSMVDGLARPILDNEADHTIGAYTRKGGRVTELTARPLLGMFFPEIDVRQPLAGEFAFRREAIPQAQIEPDWGVESGLLIDSWLRGNRVSEVDLGRKEHDMKDLAELHVMARQVARTIIGRAVAHGRLRAAAEAVQEEELLAEPVPV